MDNIRPGPPLSKALYGHAPAADFDSVALEALRGKMIEADICRNLVNKDIDRISGPFRWAAAKKLVPLAVYQSLQTLSGLRPADPRRWSAACPGDGTGSARLRPGR